MYQRVSVIGVGITTVKQACQNLSHAAPLVFSAASRHCVLVRIVDPRMLQIRTVLTEFIKKFSSLTLAFF